MIDFTLGADPEVFLFDVLQNKYVASSTYFRGTKGSPKEFGDGFSVLCDNLMVEFNIPPSTDRLGFIQNLNIAIDHIKRQLPEHIELHFNQKVIFDVEELLADGADEYGCAPQDNIYNLDLDCMEDMPVDVRFAGGHIHFGCREELDIPRIVKLFDLYVGLPMAQHEGMGGNISRKDVYGAPGTYRLTSYGFEYRTPSNEWLQSDERMNWVYTQIEKAVSVYQDEELELPSDEEITAAFYSEVAANQLLENYLVVA